MVLVETVRNTDANGSVPLKGYSLLKLSPKKWTHYLLLNLSSMLTMKINLTFKSSRALRNGPQVMGKMFIGNAS